MGITENISDSLYTLVLVVVVVVVVAAAAMVGLLQEYQMTPFLKLNYLPCIKFTAMGLWGLSAAALSFSYFWV